MSNPWTSSGGNLTGLARDILPITPSDISDIAPNTVAVGILCVGGSGNVSFVTAAGTTRTVPMVTGDILPVGASRVLETGTTATGLWGFIA